jgi:hypothetical protein
MVFDTSMLITNELLYSLFLPFILIFALLFGALEVVHVFNKRINLVLALVFTLFATQTPVFSWFATILPLYGAVAVLGVFAVLFVFGIIKWGYSRGREIYWEVGGTESRIKHLSERMEKLWKEYEKARDQGKEEKMRVLWKEIEEIERELRFLRHK